MSIIVKPMKWEIVTSIVGDVWKSETIVGTYYVDNGEWWLDMEGEEPERNHRFKNDEMAKQACWHHFESIVRSAIDGEIAPTAALHDRLEELAMGMKGEYPTHTITDVMQASRMIKGFGALISRGCDHCADSIRIARKISGDS